MSNGANNYVQTIRTYRDDFSRGEQEFRAALPPHISPAKFIRVAMTAIQNADQGELMRADRSSVRNAVLRCAADGLMMDGREAALVIYKGQAQYQPMVRGIMKLARNSGEIAKIVAQVVYERDEFEIQFVTDESPIVHRPNLQDRGSMIGVYALAYLKDGTWTDPEWMTVEQVNKIRARSFAKNSGPWVTDYEQMALKTVIKRAAKRWPSSTDLDDAIHADDSEYSAPPIEHIDQETGEVVSMSPESRASRTAHVLRSRVSPSQATQHEQIESGLQDKIEEDATSGPPPSSADDFELGDTESR